MYKRGKDMQNMTDQELMEMSKLQANMKLDDKDKRRWVELHNATANLYFFKNGHIEDVPAEGWWY